MVREFGYNPQAEAPPEYGIEANVVKSRRVNLSRARVTPECLEIGGSLLWAVDATSVTATCNIALNDQRNDFFPVSAGLFIRGVRFSRIFLTNTAQANQSITFIYAAEGPGNIQVENPASQFSEVTLTPATIAALNPGALDAATIAALNPVALATATINSLNPVGIVADDKTTKDKTRFWAGDSVAPVGGKYSVIVLKNKGSGGEFVCVDLIWLYSIYTDVALGDYSADLTKVRDGKCMDFGEADSTVAEVQSSNALANLNDLTIHCSAGYPQAPGAQVVLFPVAVRLGNGERLAVAIEAVCKSLSVNFIWRELAS